MCDLSSQSNMFTFGGILCVTNDTCSIGFGVILSREYLDGERVVCFLPRSRTRQDKNYLTTERESLVVILAIENLRYNSESRPLEIITDCYSLLWLQNRKDLQYLPAICVQCLHLYDFEFNHGKVKDHIIPDILSPLISPIEQTSVKSNRKFVIVRERKPERYPSWSLENGISYKNVFIRDMRCPENLISGKQWYLRMNDELCWITIMMNISLTIRIQESLY